MKRLIVTGCGRSGTGFISSVLTSCGFDCGHESVFDPTQQKSWGSFRGDASWCAAAYLDRLEDVRVLHLVRDPLDCAISYLGIRFFYVPAPPERRERHQLIRRMTPSVLNRQSELDRFLDYWVCWNRLVEKRAPRDHGRVRLEDVDVEFVEEVLETFGVQCEPSKICEALELHRGRNGRERAELSPNDLKASALYEPVQHLARAYGYDC